MANDLILLGAGRSGSSGGESLPVTVFSDDFERASSALGGVANGWSDPSTGWQISTISGSQRATGPGGGYNNPKLMRAVSSGRCVISVTVPTDVVTPPFLFRMTNDYQTGSCGYGNPGGGDTYYDAGVAGFAGGNLGSGSGSACRTYDTALFPASGFIRKRAFMLTEGSVALAYYQLAESLPFAISVHGGDVTRLNVGFTPFSSATKCIDDFSEVTQVATTRAIAVGDSITGFGWPERAQVYTGQSWDWYNRGIAAYEVSNLITEYTSGAVHTPSVETLITGSSIRTVLVMAGGTNDLAANQSAATLKTRMTSYAALANGDGVDEIWACTLLPRGAGFGGGADAASFEVQRLIYNADLLVNFASMGYAGVIDWAGLTEMNDYTDTQKYSDQVHPTGWGSMFLAKCVSDAIT